MTEIEGMDTHKQKKHAPTKGSSSKFKHKKRKLREKKVVLKKLQVEKKEINQLIEQYDQITPADIEKFSDFPLSGRTKSGLTDAGYEVPTEIQRMTIGLALQGHDVLGAAKTGSGKTLAFLIPILECLYRNSWSMLDGLGALVISPTRELAYQTFEVLCKIGAKHDFSAGLVIGGKDLKTEMERLPKTNIIICTPGRLLQHMDETACFESLNLQMLVLDEADRILDLGFQRTMDAIFEHLPSERQTLLFSATQTKSVRDLARLSLQDPKYVAVHEHHTHSTPVQLDQSYIVCELEQKLDVLYSFIKAHLNQKILVFMASCKQVKFVFEMFCKLNPGISVMALYGSLHQLRRVAVYEEFCVRESAVLLATDIAARGLDFPAVHWVVQLDCPEDSSTYIHRVGRTARYEKNGEALLVLLPSEEEAMVAELEKRKIPIEKIQVNPNKRVTVEKKLQSYCAQSLELKQSAQRAFIAYLKSVYLMKNKDVFKVHKLALDSFARSLGLAVAPRVRFIQRAEKRKEEQNRDKRASSRNEGIVQTNAGHERTLSKASISAKKKGYENEEDSSSSEGELESEEEKMPRGVASEEGYSFHGDGDEDEDDLLVKKSSGATEQIGAAGDDGDEDLAMPERQSKKSDKPLTKYALAKKIRKKNLTINTKKIFDEDGEVQAQWPPAQPTKASRLHDDEEEEGGGIDIEKAKQFMAEEDKHDKQLFKERIKAKHLMKRLKEKKEKKTKRGRKESDDEDEGVHLGTTLNVEEEEEFDPMSLPDPDKFSAFVSDEEDDDDAHKDVDKEDVSKVKLKPAKQSSKPSKRKSSKENTGKKKKRKQKMPFEEEEEEGVPMDTGMSLQDDEQLALHMLSSNRL